VSRKPFPQYAPHLSEEVVAANREVISHRLTIDRTLQVNLEDLARSAAHTLGPRLSLAIMVADNASGDVLAYIGSPDYLDPKRLGAIDMASAIRSPGSTLKPLVYGLAFEAGIVHPDTLIDDKPTRFGRYAPKNFDDTFHGTVTVREALRQSLNVPAVKVLAAVGPARMMARLNEAGIHYELPLDAGPSLAVGLGGVGLTLRDLTELYADIARGGRAMALRDRIMVADNRTVDGGRTLLGKVSAWYIQSILRGTSPPRNAKGGDIAYKTGTSYGYRDAWAAGFDGKHTIAVWVGRPDGMPEPGITGVGTAAPILFDSFARLPGRRAAFASAPEGAEVGIDLPPPLKVFLPDKLEHVAGKPFADPELAIAFPPDSAEIALDQGADGSQRPLIVKAEGGVLPLTWMVDDEPVASEPFSREATLRPHGKGFAKLSVVDATGRVDRVTVSIR
jgi:penicillin-binding protein 1C